MGSKVLASKKPRIEVKKKPLNIRVQERIQYFLNVDRKIQKEMIFHVLGKTLVYILLVLGAIITVFPFYYMIITSLNPATMLQPGLKPYWGCEFIFSNYLKAWNLQAIKPSAGGFIDVLAGIPRLKAGTTIGTWFYNTIITVLINTVLTVFTTILAAFSIAKLKYVGRSKIFGVLLMTMMIPGEILTVQNLVTINYLEWTNTYQALIAPFISSVFYIFLLVQLFLGIPDSLYKAARVDGCGDWKFLWRVLVPMSTNTLATISVLNAIASWNAYLWPSLVVNDPKMQVLSVGLYDYTAAANAMDVFKAPNYVMAAAVLVIAPMFIVYLFLRKQIIAGVSRSGTKG